MTELVSDSDASTVDEPPNPLKNSNTAQQIITGWSLLDWWQRLQIVTTSQSLPLHWYIMKWIVPWLFAVMAFFFQNVCLHIATYYYIGWMSRLTSNMARHRPLNETDRFNETLSSHLADGSLHDIFTNYFGYQQMPMTALDAISGAVCFIWLFLVVYRLNLRLFAKCCFCGVLLSTSKGICAIATIMPDSGGWDNCKERLGDDGVNWFLSNLNFEDFFRGSVWNMVTFEVFGTNGHHVRYCSDMVFSGHTYVATLFAIALYDAIWQATQKMEGKKTKFMIRFVVGSLMLFVVALDITLILLNKFHYTLDVYLAVLIVYLVYTNGPIARLATWWSHELWIPVLCQDHITMHADGELLVPPCFPPFCFGPRRLFITEDNDAETIDRLMRSHRFHCPGDYISQMQAAVDWAQQFEGSPVADLDLQILRQHLEGYKEAYQRAKIRKKTEHGEVAREDVYRADHEQDTTATICGTFVSVCTDDDGA